MHAYDGSYRRRRWKLLRRERITSVFESEEMTMVELHELFDRTYFGNKISHWLISAGIAIGLLLVLLLIRRFVRARYAKLAATPEIELIEVPFKAASRTTGAFLLLASIFVAMQGLELPAKVSRFAITVFTVAAFWQIGLWTTTALLASLERKQRTTLATHRAAAGTLGIIGFIARVTIWAFVLLLTLDNLGIEIKPLLAGLGIGGIAVALAVQNVLGDLLASLSITLDRPFVVGDALAVDNFNGTVEYIGVKSTRLRSLDGEQIIMPNSNLLSSRLRNYTRMTERRVVYPVSVTQETPREKLEKIPGLIRSLIEEHKDVRFDRSHFSRIGAASYDFEAVYIVLTSDYARHMDILQTINLKLIEAFEKDGVRFAFPTQRLWLEQDQSVRSELIAGEKSSEPTQGAQKT
jgi:small-conductance mechanosensitive channel